MKRSTPLKRTTHWSLQHCQKETNQLVSNGYIRQRNAKGEVEKYKARLVVKGYKQQYGIDYDDVLAPIARMEML